MLQRDEFFYYLNKYANIYFTGNDMSAEIQKSFSFMQREYADIIATIFYVMFNKEYKYGPKFLYNLQLTRKNEEHAAKSGTTEPAELTGLGKLFGPISEPSPVVSGKYAEVDVLKSINGQKRIIDGYRIWADVKSTRVDMEIGLKEYERAFQQLRKAGKIIKEFTGRVIRGKYKEYVYKAVI